MAIEAMLVHTCTIKRRSETVASQELTFNTDTTIASNVECFIQSSGVVKQLGPSGIGSRRAYTGLFPANTDIEDEDVITWNDQSIDLEVVGVEKVHGFDAAIEQHVEVSLMERDV